MEGALIELKSLFMLSLHKNPSLVISEETKAQILLKLPNLESKRVYWPGYEPEQTRG